MKRYLYLFLIGVMLYMPAVVYASSISYNTSLNYVNGYIEDFTGYQKYLVTDTDKYSFTGGVINSKSGFLKSGYLNLDEYIIIGQTNSFLYDGQNYYTMTDKVGDSSSIYKISHEDLNGYKDILKNIEDLYAGTRVTQYINKSTKLTGAGTYESPWKFIDSDVTGPEVTFNKNSDTTWRKTQSVTVTVEDAESFVKKGQNIKYRWQTDEVCSTHIDDYTNTVPLSNAGVDINIATASISESVITGQYYLCIAAGIEDTKGNFSSYAGTTGKFYLDNTKPVITNINLTVTESNVTVSIDNTDTGSGIETYYYGYSVSPAACTPNTSSTINGYTYTLADGTYNMCSKITDKAGNVSDIVSKSVTVATKITYAQLIADYSCANGSAGSAPYIMTYTGNCSILDDGNGNWRVKLTSTGTKYLTFTRGADVNVFIVGGGGGGGGKNSWSAGGGGGGGRTTTASKTILANTSYPIVIGSGGGKAASGVASSAFGSSASGGNGGTTAPGTSDGGPGGSGGSGGGGGACNCSKSNGGTGGNGGSYGNGGSSNNRNGTKVPGGSGQGSTTCEFGEGNLSACTRGSSYVYSGGGGGGAGQSSNGKGAVGTNGACGGGYGCGGRGEGTTASYVSGTQGIVIIRDAR